MNRPDPADGLDVLTKVGGFEIGVLGGVALGGALARRAVVLDGFISGAAGLIAQSLCPTVLDYVIAGHLSAEPGHRIALEHMGLSASCSISICGWAKARAPCWRQALLRSPPPA